MAKPRQKITKDHERTYKVAVVGGLGHVGLPLGIAFANAGLDTVLLDIDEKKAKKVESGEMPFIEYGAEEILPKVVKNKKLQVSLDQRVIQESEYVVICLGTPVDEYLNPKTRSFMENIARFQEYLDPSQTIIIRSTVYPRSCEQLERFLARKDRGPWKIAYCPERIAQGYAIRELGELPQIVAGINQESFDSAKKLFESIAPQVIQSSIEEAELAKLFCNAWRYIQFSVANQFFMMSKKFGVEYNAVRDAMVEGYGRAASLPRAGFAAGPCLLKDTMQLAAFDNNSFHLGHAAMMVNEGLPNFIVEQLRSQYVLQCATVGILGMAFKADVDDIRDSLSYKLGKVLRFHGAKVLYSDEFVKDPTFVPRESLIEQSNIVIVATNHSAYKGMEIPEHIGVVDLWGVTHSRSKVM